MTESDLAIQLGLVEKRSNSFNDTIILNQRLIDHILSLKREKDEEIEIEEFELAEEDSSPTEAPHLAKQEEKIFELKSIPNFVWQQTEHQIGHPVYKPRKVLSMKAYVARKFKEAEADLFSEENFSTLTKDEQERLIKLKEKIDNFTNNYNMAS